MWSELQKAASSRPAHSSPPTTQQLHAAASRILSHFEEEASEAFGERSRADSCASLASATEEDLASMPPPELILAKEDVPLSAPPASPATPMLTSAVTSVASLVAQQPAETAAETAAPEDARDEDASDPPDEDEDDGAGSDFVYDGGDDDARPKEAPPPAALLQDREREELDRQRRREQEQGVRLLHRVAAFTAGGELRAWVACAPEAEAMLLVHGVRALQREVTQAQADAINAQVQLRLLEEDSAAADEESSARAELRAANERAARLEAALAEQAAALAAERADRSALVRQHEAGMVAKDVELKELTSQLQRAILQRLEQQPKTGPNNTKGGASSRSTSR